MVRKKVFIQSMDFEPDLKNKSAPSGADCCHALYFNSLAVQCWAASKAWQAGVCSLEDDLLEACSREDGDRGVCLWEGGYDGVDGFEAVFHVLVVY